MRINLASVLVDDQHKALRFYTDILGLVTTAVFDDTCGNLIQIAARR
jgi:catechol 2,3-dioxygenase-like lactoylglutathione lyase family enzyme